MGEISLGSVTIETVRGCNFCCKMCPSSSEKMEKKMKFMSLDTAKLVVERMNAVACIESIWPFGFGESLAHPDIYNLYTLFNGIKRSENTPVVLHTNASLLYGEAAYAILEIPFITQLYISFDGYGTEESFVSMRGNHWREVIDRTRNFALMAQKKRPGLYIGTCSIYPEKDYMPSSIQYFSYEEAESRLKAIFEPMGVHVSIRGLHNYNGYYQPAIYKKEKYTKKRVQGGCRYLEEHSCTIRSNGKIAPCCDGLNEDFTIGDLRYDSFQEIYEGTEYLTLRHFLRLDEREKICECANCDKYSFGSDIEAGIRYWKKEIEDGNITDMEEFSYLNKLISDSEEKKQ